MRSHNWKDHNQFLVYVFALLCAFFWALTLTPQAEAGPMAEHEAKLNGQKKQIEGLEGEIRELIQHKQHEHDAKQVQELIKEIANKHKELEKVSQEYEEVRLHVRFHHPDRNETVERKYLRYKFKSLKEMEDEFGIDGRLDRIKTRVSQTFPAPKPELKKNEPHAGAGLRKPASEDEEGFEAVKLVK
jgi:DNA repair exonuclease SbcCD ATPase subunit